ncbi:hypothetical protein AB0N31_21915 [Streptomyces sp. NPDC051051]|uniref:hypothetical protein n=1 Tax=Streptomyces sp. NPDC051051 TaxID=3155666 RepID=UPI00341B37CE
MGVACVMLLSPLTACTSDDTEQPAQRTHSSEPGTPTATASPATAEPPVRQPPELDADETLAGQQRATSGNADVEFIKGKKGDALVVAVRCQGRGKMNVSVPSVHVSFPLECLAGEVSTTYNQVAVTGVDRSGNVSVHAPSSVRWSMTIGRGAPVAEESPDTP